MLHRTPANRWGLRLTCAVFIRWRAFQLGAIGWQIVPTCKLARVEDGKPIPLAAHSRTSLPATEFGCLLFDCARCCCCKRRNSNWPLSRSVVLLLHQVGRQYSAHTHTRAQSCGRFQAALCCRVSSGFQRQRTDGLVCGKKLHCERERERVSSFVRVCLAAPDAASSTYLLH